MSKPVRDALDQTTDTTTTTTTTTTTVDAGRPRRLPLSLRRTRAFGRTVLKATVVAALAMGAVTGTPGSANAADRSTRAIDPVDIGSAASFGVLAGSSVGNSDSTTVTGDLGISPGNTLVGFPPGVVSGSTHLADATAAQAKADAVAAYNDIVGRAPTATVSPQLGGTTKGPGVYNSTSGNFSIDGTLTLDAQGDPGAVFIFKSTILTAASISNIALLRGAQADNVFWQVGDTATLGTYCTFRGNILAQNSVGVNSGANVIGRAFGLGITVSIQGTNSLPHTRVTVPNDPPTTTNLTVSASSAWTGYPITLTAAVQAVSGSIVPAGEVVFKDGSTVLGSAWHDDQGPARITVSDLVGGEHQIIAVYLGGDTFDHEALIHFAPSTSVPVTVNISDSLWDNSGTPAASQADPQPITVGVKFRATTSGTVTAVRFYKGAQNTGTHTGSLWTSGGSLLSSATFTDESPTGWQQATFATPVPITAGTTYIAAYHTTSGNYSVTRPYFTTSRTNGPLVALANGTEGGNGVYTYGATSTFPTSSVQATNYWVDVVFVPTNSLWDKVATPAVLSQPDSRGTTLGVKFKPTTNGKVSGVRFYKGAQNTGTHTVLLYAANGERLVGATSTPADETATGWQQVNFAAPVDVTADTTYIAAYHTTSGNYSVTRPYFTSQYANGSLVALANGAEGPNGIYRYGITAGFPSLGYQSTNYWVDPVFNE
ncbi:DUF4082 domain-containing protein [Streptosporangium sp. NBC_01810]|uniref:DUF4082 domain-containing protein n=1 Tax=Streptosporangium sp. NBC_01810 TaxID=2975951 RepID=UPI002DD9BE12|nr:DUF4082 domain-containing protein [Streptosporangium sp. NBC_01810]WSA27664.1 DUF4082 domain-containing protein [Streptosporangium sp. NBC_01810]